MAFEAITSGAEAYRYGIELDAYRAEQARQRIPNVVEGNTLEVQCAVESLGLSFTNPPYDWMLGPADSRRTEQAFLSHTYRWLKTGGILVFIIPGERLAECSQILATQFRDVRIYRPRPAQSQTPPRSPPCSPVRTPPTARPIPRRTPSTSGFARSDAQFAQHQKPFGRSQETGVRFQVPGVRGNVVGLEIGG